MRFFISLFLLFTVLELGACRQCYVCITANAEQKCQDSFVKSEHTLETCSGSNQVCFKEKINPSASISNNIVRGCAVKGYCEDGATKSQFCQTCSEDGCNSSSMMIPSFVVVVPFLIKQFL